MKTLTKADDRTPEQKQTHRWGVVARDKFMSGWGRASNGDSRCAWACAPDVDVDRVERWVRSRREQAIKLLQAVTRPTVEELNAIQG